MATWYAERDGLAFAKSGDDSGSFRADLESNVAQERMSVDAISGGARRGALAQPQAMADMRAVGSVLESSESRVSGAAGELGPQAVQVRSDFRVTALWEPAVMTGADGRATVELKMPDSQTTWRATARAVSEGNRFGMGSSSTRSKKPLIVPVTRAALLRGWRHDHAVGGHQQQQRSRSDGEPGAPGVGAESTELELRLALRRRHGTRGFHRRRRRSSGRLDSERRAGGKRTAAGQRRWRRGFPMPWSAATWRTSMASTSLWQPLARLPAASPARPSPCRLREWSIPRSCASLSARAWPSPCSMRLPYLVHYPYGCTEQTMSRFLPAVITAGTLGSVGLDPAVAMSRVFGGIEQATAVQNSPEGDHGPGSAR